MNNQYFIVMPVFNPNKMFISLLQELVNNTDVPVVVVNDGSDDIYKEVFFELKKNDNVIYLENYINLGKGAALKNAFNHLLTNYPSLIGVVTADADGQHAIQDIVNILETYKENNKSLVLGTRVFGEKVPLKSRVGNLISNYIYSSILKQKYNDTQTGLRGIPTNLIKESLLIKSNRYEFETEQLIKAAELNIGLVNENIDTIYIDNNSESHFNPLFDSMRIYYTLLRYGSVSLITALTDFIAYAVMLFLYQNIWVANASGRASTIFIQFYLLRKFVFKTDGGLRRFLMFVLYVVIAGILSASAQQSLILNFSLHEISSKIIVDGALFILNFLFLRDIVFTKNNND